jgi:hypothetical protein
MPENENKNPQELQNMAVAAMTQFLRENPEIEEAMQIMNMSLSDYLQAMESVRTGPTVSYSTYLQA